MKIAPLQVSDPWFGRITGDKTAHIDTLTGVPMEATVEVELVELLHEGPESNYRPYLHLRGELTEVKPAVALPYGVSELALRRGSGLPLDAFYEFTGPQLADLVTKGYFTPAFQVPSEMSGIPWTLPGEADFMVVAPAFADEAPVVFMAVANQTGMELDEANSGYELSAYFPDYSAEAEAAAILSHEGQETPLALQGGDDQRDLFSDITHDQRVPESIPAAANEPAAGGERHAVPDGVFSRLVEEIEARQRPAAVVEPEQELADEQEPSANYEDLYLARVEAGVARVLAGGHLDEDEGKAEHAAAIEQRTDVLEAETPETVEAEDEQPLDLSEPEPEIESFNLQDRFDAEDHRAAAERRASRLRADAAAQAAADEDDQQITL